MLCINRRIHGPLTRYAKLWVAYATGMPGTFSPPLRVSDPDMHHGTCVMHVPWCISGGLTSYFLWSQGWGKRSRHSRCMQNPQFCVSGKRPVGSIDKKSLFGQVIVRYLLLIPLTNPYYLVMYLSKYNNLQQAVKLWFSREFIKRQRRLSPPLVYNMACRLFS